MTHPYVPSHAQSPQRALDTFESEYYALQSSTTTAATDRNERIALYEKTIASYRAKAG